MNISNSPNVPTPEPNETQPGWQKIWNILKTFAALHKILFISLGISILAMFPLQIIDSLGVKDVMLFLEILSWILCILVIVEYGIFSKSTAVNRVFITTSAFILDSYIAMQFMKTILNEPASFGALGCVSLIFILAFLLIQSDR